MSDAKSENKETNVRVLYAREICTRFFVLRKLLKTMVARDGIEPPTPAFSGPLTDSRKWFEINGYHSRIRDEQSGIVGRLNQPNHTNLDVFLAAQNYAVLGEKDKA